MASSLLGILDKGSESLQNSRVAIDVTGHNISNAQTPGFSRQTVNLETKHPTEYGLHILGSGAQIQSISRAQDKFLNHQIQKEVQVANKTKITAEGLSKLESLFNPDLTSTIRDRINLFGNALRDFANAPDDNPVRSNVIENAKALTGSFHQTIRGVVKVQEDCNEQIQQNLLFLNQKLEQVAKLNGQIREAGAGMTSEANDQEDTRDKLVEEIGTLIDINVYKDTNNSVVIRGPGECLLVDGNLSSHLKLKEGDSASAMPRLMVSSFSEDSYTDMTDKTKSGKIGAFLDIRDHYASDVRQQINELAQGFGNALNQIHSQGYGIHDSQDLSGLDFFQDLDKEGDVAENIEVNTSLVENLDSLAGAMTPNSSGDNVIANKMIKLFYEPVFDNQSSTITGFYDKLISQLGNQTMQAKESAEAADVVFKNLKTQKESVVGVSLDEEASNLLKYQHLFTASSKIINTVDDMYKTILGLGR